MNTLSPRSSGDTAVAPNADGAALQAGMPADEPVHPMRSHARSTMNQLAGDAARVARGSVDVARRQAVSLRDAGSEYVRVHPLLSVLVAAGTGVLLASLLRRRGGTPD